MVRYVLMLCHALVATYTLQLSVLHVCPMTQERRRLQTMLTLLKSMPRSEGGRVNYVRAVSGERTERIERIEHTLILARYTDSPSVHLEEGVGRGDSSSRKKALPRASGMRCHLVLVADAIACFAGAYCATAHTSV